MPEEARVWCTPEEHVMSGKAYRVILDVAEQDAAEIIVRGVHGKGVLNRCLFELTIAPASEREAVRAAGARFVLLKPYLPDQLAAVIDCVLGGSLP
jgi:nucleotide-binding universal stress UspA family protein